MTRKRTDGLRFDKYGMLRDGPDAKMCRERLWSRALDHNVDVKILANAYNVHPDTIVVRVRNWRRTHEQAKG